MEKIASTVNALTLRISLEDIEPEIWRRFAVLDNISLSELHMIIQKVMGWTNSHLYSFFIKKNEYTDKISIRETGRGMDADSVTLSGLKLKKGDVFEYIYDWGDKK
jgi:hypothetical protein